MSDFPNMYVQIIISSVRVAEWTPFEKELVVSKFGVEDRTLVVLPVLTFVQTSNS